MHSTSPSVSIVTPLFNRERLIGETIQSVLQQTRSDWEMLVVDDGSTDDSLAVAAEFGSQDERIIVSRRESQTKGANVCRNEGLANANGKYIVFLDSDDLLANHCLERRIQITEQGSQDFEANVFPMRHFRNQPGDMQSCWFLKTPESMHLTGFLDGPLWGPTCVFWRRDTLIEMRGFADHLPSWQDWELHVRALINGLRFNMCDVEPDSYFRRSRGDNIGSASNSLPHLETRTALIHQVVKQLIAAGKLTPENKALCVEQFRRIAIQLFLAGSHQQATDLGDSLLAQGLVSEHQSEFWKRSAKSAAHSIKLKRLRRLEPVKNIARYVRTRLAG